MTLTREQIKERAVDREMISLGFRHMGFSFAQIGFEMGVSRSRAWDIYQKAIRRICSQVQREMKIAKMEKTI